MTERCPCDCSKLPEFTDLEAFIAMKALDLPEAPLHHVLPDIEEPFKPSRAIIETVRLGMNHELEHCDITCGDPIMTAKIALAHLREDPEYYEKLKKVEDKDWWLRLQGAIEGDREAMEEGTPGWEPREDMTRLMAERMLARRRKGEAT